MLNLVNIKLNTVAKISDIALDEKLQKRLLHMGFYIGCNVKVTNRSLIGKNVVVEIIENDVFNKIMLNRTEAELIFLIPSKT